MTRRSPLYNPPYSYSNSTDDAGLIVPPPAPRSGVCLTGFWRIATMLDVAMANDLAMRAVHVGVDMVVPVLHVVNKELLNRLDSGFFLDAVLWKSPLEFSTKTQRALMEAVADSCGKKWIWEADLDERLPFDMDVRCVVANADKQDADYVAGDWVDCFSEDGELHKVEIIGDREPLIPYIVPLLEEQFPARGYLVRDFSKGCPTKVALHRYDCLTCGGNHRPREAGKVAADFSLPILHFKWHAAMEENAKGKAAAARSRGQAWFAEQERCFQRLEDGRIPERFLRK